jgi:Ca2+-binding EF-hand superfamily protein
MFERLLAKGDKNGDGALSKEEFVEAIRAIRGAFAGAGQGAPGGQAGPGGRPDPEQIFKHLDKNGDGKITADEVPEERREMFQKLLEKGDKNGDKALSKEEFIEAFRALGNRGADGPPGNGPAGNRRPEGRERPEGRPGREALFKRWDKNGDGKVTADEVPEQARGLFQRMLERFDKNGDKALSKEEFDEAIKARDERGAGKRPEGRRAEAGDSERRRPPGPPPGRPGGLFAALDTDGDGVLSEAEIAAAPAVLRKLDKNGDGKLTREEAMGAPAPPPRDRDGDSSSLERGGSGFDNFDAQRGRRAEDLMLAIAKRRFREIDANGDGVIDEEEFLRHAQQMIERMERFAQDGPGRGRIDAGPDGGRDRERRPPPPDRGPRDFAGPPERGGPPDRGESDDRSARRDRGGPPPRDFDDRSDE